MKEIKFRGKRLDNGEWAVGCLIWRKITDTVTDYYIMYNVITYKVDPNTVGQYTGEKDKNGIEIYERDILSRKDWGMGGGHDPEERYKVGLIDDYIYEEEQSWHFKVHLWGEWCEVIGNIHDNPELIKEVLV